MPVPETEILNNLVARVFHVEDVTLGEPARGLIARYRGRLISEDTESAYDRLAESLKPYSITPLFRAEKGQHLIYLTPTRPAPKPARVSINIILFILTVLSVLYVGSFMARGGEPLGAAPSDPVGMILSFVSGLLSGWPYAVSLMAILLAHEFGHYLMSRYHKTLATLPYFIPLPFPLSLGTLGAAIMMQETPKNKRILFDIGVAGPLAGMVVAIPVLFYGLSISHLGVIQIPAGMIEQQEGNSLLYLLAKYVMFGKLLPDPATTRGLSLPLYWLKNFFTGLPAPIGATDVITHPFAFAGWVGLLVTSLNLIPAGTLDGGHVIYSLFGDKASKAFPYIFVTLLALGLFWNGWWLWAVLLLWLGRVHAEPLDQITSLDPRRRWIAVLVIVIFILTFTPVPLMILGL